MVEEEKETGQKKGPENPKRMRSKLGGEQEEILEKTSGQKKRTLEEGRGGDEEIGALQDR